MEEIIFWGLGTLTIFVVGSLDIIRGHPLASSEHVIDGRHLSLLEIYSNDEVIIGECGPMWALPPLCGRVLELTWVRFDLDSAMTRVWYNPTQPNRLLSLSTLSIKNPYPKSHYFIHDFISTMNHDSIAEQKPIPISLLNPISSPGFSLHLKVVSRSKTDLPITERTRMAIGQV